MSNESKLIMQVSAREEAINQCVRVLCEVAEDGGKYSGNAFRALANLGVTLEEGHWLVKLTSTPVPN